MPLSLVSAPVLGFDLVRHPNGPGVAAILIRAMQLQPVDLPRFGRPFPASGPSRAQCWDAIADAQASAGLGSLRGSYVPRRTGDRLSVLETVADDLVRSMIVDLDDLRRLIGAEILAWTDADRNAAPAEPAGSAGLTGGSGHPEQAVLDAEEALFDAVAAQWITGLWPDGEAGPEAVALTGRYRAAEAGLGDRPVDVGPAEASVAAVLDQLRRCTDSDRARLRTIGQVMRASGSQWAEAVHDASWAAYTTGRVRAAAMAQLLGVQAFRAGGFDATDGAEGLWNLVSGHLQACVMGDVLSDETLTTLTRAWTAAFGR
ncbi:hypothetical protein M6D93_06160 [Jatrophihabitans telluris]|uniref:DUF4192 family protein n=1 Tax=Jatrophihabitans telluris TaxID=2038343 RepID=A0ABY4R272_9ACTN|nr:hypothetical protein [Jatrophihabitans telluris]UQX89587.1 hypothetical protein M6D93_06160 [Jatrophihabitans telluris]